MSDSGFRAASSSPCSVPAISTRSRLSLFLDRAGLQGFPWVSAIVLYTISWGWLLFVRDSYWWDDWAHILTDMDEAYAEAGHAPWFRFYNYMIRTYSPSILHLVIFLIYFLSSLSVFRIISDLKFRLDLVDVFQSQWIVLFYLLIPINTTRVSLNLFQYGFSLMLFFLAWHVLISFSGTMARLSAIALFALSFALPSLIALMVMPLLHYLIKVREENSISDKRVLAFFFVLVSLPIIFFVTRQLYFPNGSASYQFKSNKVDDALFLCTFGIVGLVALFFTKPFKLRSSLVGMFIGFEVCALGLFAYMSTNQIGEKFWLKYPTMIFGRSGWFGRQLILQPLGLSILLVATVVFLSRNRYKIERLLMKLLLGVFVVFNLGFGFEYVVDFHKQIQVANAIENAGGDNTSKWIFIDDSTRINARGREYSVYDWAGMVSMALPTVINSKTIENELIISGELFATKCDDKLAVDSGKSSQDKQLDVNVVLIQGPETHWQALMNWVRDRDMGFKVTIDDRPGACKPEMVTAERVSGMIPILFYFTGAKN